MNTINPFILVIVSGAFGALITYFFKNVFQSKAVSKTVEESVNAAFKTHVLIHHKRDPAQIVSDKIAEYSKEVEYKLEQRDKLIAAISESYNVTKNSLHGIDISIAGILGELKLLKAKGAKVNGNS